MKYLIYRTYIICHKLTNIVFWCWQDMILDRVSSVGCFKGLSRCQLLCSTASQTNHQLPCPLLEEADHQPTTSSGNWTHSVTLKSISLSVFWLHSSILFSPTSVYVPSKSILSNDDYSKKPVYGYCKFGLSQYFKNWEEYKMPCTRRLGFPNDTPRFGMKSTCWFPKSLIWKSSFGNELTVNPFY